MMTDCEIKKQEAQPSLAARQVVPVEKLPEVLGRVFGAIMAYLDDLKKKPAGPPFVAYLNMDMQALDVEVGFPVHDELPAKGELKPTTIPGLEVATCMHTGPYDAIEDTYTAFSECIKQQNVETGDPVYEFYLSSPDQVPVDKLKTRLVFLLKPR
nr:GyrI-like domain-containing protein [Candidatus Sigynarchaeum springense]